MISTIIYPVFSVRNSYTFVKYSTIYSFFLPRSSDSCDNSYRPSLLINVVRLSVRWSNRMKIEENVVSRSTLVSAIEESVKSNLPKIVEEWDVLRLLETVVIDNTRHLLYSNNNIMSGTKADANKEDSLKRQGSFRKLLPLDTNGDSQLSMSVKMIDRPTVSQSNKEYSIYLQEYNILSEYKMLCSQDLKGVYVIPSAQNSLLWFGVQFGRQGIYQGGVFRFTITLPQNFPDGGCPRVVFQTPMFHPLIDPESGELCTSWAFTEWRRNNRVWQLVQFITKILIKVDIKMTPVNQEASTLLENNFEEFRDRVKKCVKESLSNVYDPPMVNDPHYIVFDPYNHELHDPVKREIYEPKEEEENKTLGLSWVQPGSLQPFSKPEAR